jgi:hypothetical protein
MNQTRRFERRGGEAVGDNIRGLTPPARQGDGDPAYLLAGEAPISENREARNIFQEPAVRLSQIGFILFAAVCSLASSLAAEERTIAQIEQRLHNPRRAEGRQGVFREVLRGKGTEEEKKEMLELFKALAKSKPPRGSQENWEKATAALVTAAKEIVAGTVKDMEKLRAASNCKACHDAHRGPDPALAADGTRVEEAGSFGKTAPPQFVKVSNISKDKLNITVYHHESKPVTSFREETIEMDGKTRKVQVPVTEMVSELRQSVISLQYVRLRDSTGKEIKGDEVWKRLKPGVTLLRQTAATEIDPTFLKLLSADAMILTPSVLPAADPQE